MNLRLPLTTFDIPIPEVRMGYYSAKYFNRTKEIIENRSSNKTVTMQIFNKKESVICGLDEVLAILKIGTGHWKNKVKAKSLFDTYLEYKKELRKHKMNRDFEKVIDYHKYTIEVEKTLDQLWEDCHKNLCIYSLNEGDVVKPHLGSLIIEGPYSSFAHLESLYLGILARSTRVATNTYKVVKASNGKPILYFADRFDRFSNQTADGHAALMGGAFGVASDSMGEWWGKEGLGTTPHALIAYYYGDTSKALLDFSEDYPEVNCIALVDFHNDCVKTSIEVANDFKKKGKKLWGVRLDTSGTMVDKSLLDRMGQFKPTGVVPELVQEVRTALDINGFNYVKILVSGGFDEGKIKEFENQKISVDGYGVGSSLLKGNFDFTADIVQVEGKPMSKVGRGYTPHPDIARVYL